MAPSFPLTPGNSLDRSTAPPIPPHPFKLQNPSVTLPPISDLIQYTPSPLPRSSGPVPTVLPLPRPTNADPTLPSISSFHFDPPTNHDASYPVSSSPRAVRLPASSPAPGPAPVHHYAQQAAPAPAPAPAYMQGPPPLVGVSFAGIEGEDPIKFLDHVETAIDGNPYFHQLPSEWTTRWVRMHTSGTAKKWADKHCHLSWEEFRAQFRARFVVEKSQRELWQEWRAVRRVQPGFSSGGGGIRVPFGLEDGPVVRRTR
ncbi:hypothetical protein L198_07686 [Cryptococcus wingfieldii CBS 7118]|uniref:Retrotransposon gag domain-containing protein n=1 Tax=Cryptococcus wingfieldii CBS 7118 TaxID=1295528 RepID=A0A1E3I558_9TREE|nr:hypothetical protein L198_07686 [Cryptococcus wingfieldii CBS 7118]ODN83790.1 hypothetical protein L198_07686 [Cryptococcus wingfieldii CBS 7118]